MAVTITANVPGVWVLEDDGIVGNGIVRFRRPDGNSTAFTIPADSVTLLVNVPGVTWVVDLVDPLGAAAFTVGNLTNAAQSPDAIVTQNVQAGAITLVANGSILESSVDSDFAADIVGTSLVLSAGTGVGTPAEAIETQVGVLEADSLTGRLEETSAHLNPEFGEMFDEALKRRVDHLASKPEDLEVLVEAVTIYHMVIEGMLALTGQHFIIEYNQDVGTLPGFVEGFLNVARDEHRHVAFGARFLTEMAAADPKYREAIQRTLVESLPIAEGVLRPPFAPDDDDADFELFGVSMAETQAFAAQCLTRRLKVIGLA